MTGPVKEYSDFADLRRAAIGYAQDASGAIWTDYNLHDPGVTLLEQSCFALSEIAYRVAHPDRDLLTDARSHFNFHDLALFPPRKVLNTDPVTTADLQSWLSDCPDVARVIVTPASRQHPGLYDLVIVPADDTLRPDDLQERVAHAFDQVRPLGCDRRTTRVALSRKVRLVGKVEIRPDIVPEFAAAQIYHAVALILRGLPLVAGQQGATRKDVYDEPSAILRTAARDGDRAGDLEDHLSELRALPAIRDIGELTLEQTEQTPEGDTPACRVLHLPRDRVEIGLTLLLDGVAVDLDPTRLREEYVRIEAERIAVSHHHLDASDWQVMRPGRRRDFSHRDIDRLLPIIYRAAKEAEGPGPARLSQYRHAIDGHLAAMTRDLADLPQFFAAQANLPTHDPAHWRQKQALLDYLIALQGEEMPAARHTGLHHYLGARARHRFELLWRLRYLYALPRLNAARMTGPNARGPGGFLGRIALLADLLPVSDATRETPLSRYGLRLVEDPEPSPTAQEEATFGAHDPKNLLDMLGVEDDSAALPPDDALMLTALSPDGTLSARGFQRLADPDCLFLAPDAKGWSLEFEDQPGTSLSLAEFDDLAAARGALSSLRATWRDLHHDSEEVTLVEDILLREQGDYRPHQAFLVLTGWTARTRLPAFRSYVGQLVEQHAPAHLLVHPLWLDYDQSTRFTELRRDLSDDLPGARTALRDFLHGLEDAQ